MWLSVSLLRPGWIATGIRDSSGNRPVDLADAAAPPSVSRTSVDAVATVTAGDVAEQMLDAMATNRFWILTRAEYHLVTRAAMVRRSSGLMW